MSTSKENQSSEMTFFFAGGPFDGPFTRKLVDEVPESILNQLIPSAIAKKGKSGKVYWYERRPSGIFWLMEALYESN